MLLIHSWKKIQDKDSLDKDPTALIGIFHTKALIIHKTV